MIRRRAGISRLHNSRGVGLIELLIGMGISLFLLLVMYSIFATTRSTFQVQTELAQLQEDQRAAVAVLANIVQGAGYFPNPTLATEASAFPAASAPTPLSAGQVVAGVHRSAAPGDSITVRFVADSSRPARTMDCTGSSAAGGVIVNRLWVDTTGELQCSVNSGPSFPLVGGSDSQSLGVQNLQILYGLDPNRTGSVTTYATADQVPDWTLVRSLVIDVSFFNPLAHAPGQPPTFDVVRTIALQNRLNASS